MPWAQLLPWESAHTTINMTRATAGFPEPGVSQGWDLQHLMRSSLRLHLDEEAEVRGQGLALLEGTQSQASVIPGV